MRSVYYYTHPELQSFYNEVITVKRIMDNAYWDDDMESFITKILKRYNSLRSYKRKVALVTILDTSKYYIDPNGGLCIETLNPVRLCKLYRHYKSMLNRRGINYFITKL